MSTVIVLVAFYIYAAGITGWALFGKIKNKRSQVNNGLPAWMFYGDEFQQEIYK